LSRRRPEAASSPFRVSNFGDSISVSLWSSFVARVDGGRTQALNAFSIPVRHRDLPALWGEGKNHCQHRRPGRHQTDPRPFGSTCRPTAAGLQAAGPSAPGQGSRRALRIKAYGLLPLQVRKPCPGGHGHGPSRANPRRAGSLFANENTRPGAHIRPAPSHCKETRDSSKAGTTDFRGRNRTGEC
jgi:hypothetical protein